MVVVDQLANKYLVSFNDITSINALNSREIEESLLSAVDKQNSCFTLNFSGIENMDSSGFGTLLNFYRKSKLNKCELSLINLSSPLKDLFSLVELDKVFELN